MKFTTIERRFEAYLRQHALKLTAQRRRILQYVFATHEHYSAERLYEWLRGEEGPRVSRATVYRTGPRWSPLTTSAVIGLVWAIWHLPELKDQDVELAEEVAG